jgi:chemotaxis receptor (MCP) glutamine deamidase CheD
MAAIDAQPPETLVAPDRFEIAGRNGVLTAVLDSSLAVCVCDSKREWGGLAHLRFLANAALDIDATDTTLASDLLLLDRFFERMRKSAPPWSPLGASLLASAIDTPTGERATQTVLDTVRQFLRDAGIPLEREDVRPRGELALRFVVRSNQLALDQHG